MTAEPGRVRSRRSLIAGGLAAGAFGAAWFTGLSVLGRGIHPQVLVAGDDDWQVVLIEERTRRGLLLVGPSIGDGSEPVASVLGAWRNGIDFVAGTSTAIDSLTPGMRDRLAPSLVILLDPDTGRAGSRTRMLDEGQRVRFGAFDLHLLPVAAAGPSGTPGWIAGLRVGPIAISIAPTLETIAERGDIETALAIAPAGRLAYVHSRLPAAGIATNSRNAGDVAFDVGADAPPVMLVRTFEQDVARFELRDGHLRLPSWATEVHPA